MKKIVRDNLANFITCLRIMGTVWLLALESNFRFNSLFMCVYTFCGFTDVLDGFVARKLKITSKVGSKLDSIADMLFYLVAALKFNILNILMGMRLRIPVMIIIFIRAICYIYVGYKKNELHSRHSIFNKALGFLVFIYPYMYMSSKNLFEGYVIISLFVASIGTVDEVFAIIDEFKPCESDK